MKVNNRIKYASTETNFNYGDDFIVDKEVAYMEAQAWGGAGITGMQAAGIAAEKGDNVTITEKSDRVGGQAATASHGPHGDEEFMRLVNHLKKYCDQWNVTFELPKEVTAEDIKNSDAEYIIAATGAVPRSDLPGADTVILADMAAVNVSSAARLILWG